MKRRPRNVENRVAEELSKWFVAHGWSPVERIPILGREGPDITPNEINLIIDVKSRKSCPKTYRIWKKEILWIGSRFIAVRLRDLDQLIVGKASVRWAPLYKGVQDWYYHMAESRGEDGIPALVLHWPNTDVDKSVFFVSRHDRPELTNRILGDPYGN